jgi:mono/diheme cytochrome c family protein
MKRVILLTLLSVILISYGLVTLTTSAQSGVLIFKRHGNDFRTIPLENIKKLIPPLKVEVLEPHESVKREYVGFPVNQLLTTVYGDSWKDSDDILFTCKDGYQPSIPTENFIRFSSYLVYDRPDNKEFTLINRLQGDEFVRLGPFYLIWDDTKFPEVLKIGAVHWPYQVTTIDVIDFSDRFPRMAPPKDSSHNVKSGFNFFQTYCMSCHSINGEGGKKARELNYPVNVTEYFKEPWLKKLINDPRDISYNSTMPALDPDTKDRERIIENIISYLKVMKDYKHKPES